MEPRACADTHQLCPLTRLSFRTRESVLEPPTEYTHTLRESLAIRVGIVARACATLEVPTQVWSVRVRVAAALALRFSDLKLQTLIRIAFETRMVYILNMHTASALALALRV